MRKCLLEIMRGISGLAFVIGAALSVSLPRVPENDLFLFVCFRCGAHETTQYCDCGLHVKDNIVSLGCSSLRELGNTQHVSLTRSLTVTRG